MRISKSEIEKMRLKLEIQRQKLEILIQFTENCANLDPMTLVKVSSVAQKTLDDLKRVDTYEN